MGMRMRIRGGRTGERKWNEQEVVESFSKIICVKEIGNGIEGNIDATNQRKTSQRVDDVGDDKQID